MYGVYIWFSKELTSSVLVFLKNKDEYIHCGLSGEYGFVWIDGGDGRTGSLRYLGYASVFARRGVDRDRRKTS